MKNVSLSRLWKVLCWLMPGRVGQLIIIGVFTVMFMAFHLFDVGFTDLSEEVLAKGAHDAVDSFWSIAPNLWCIGACMMFARLAERQTAFGLLMLPATMQEKFTACFLVYSIGQLFAMLIGFIVAEVLCGCLYYAMVPTAFITGLPDLWHHLLLRTYYVDGHFDLLLLLDDLCPLLWWHSICVLFASIIRRNALLYAMVPLLLLFPLMWLRDRFATELAGGLYDTWTLPLSVILPVLALIHYVVAYRLFPSRTLVGHKHLAIL